MTWFRLGLVVCATGWWVSTAHGQPSLAANANPRDSRSLLAQSEPLVVSLERKKVVNSNGQESLVSAAVANPGDILIEVASYTNRSKQALAGFQATLPVPQNTELVAGSVNPAIALASVDGRVFSAIPLKRKVKQANGAEVEVMVPVSEYRYLRWSLSEIGAEKTLHFSARFRVSQS